MRYALGDTTSSTDTTTGVDAATSSPGWLQQLVQGFTTYKLTQQQLDTQKAITDLQLRRAQAGLPPLNIDPSTLGVPTVSVGLSPATSNMIQLLVVGGLVLLGINIFTRRK